MSNLAIEIVSQTASFRNPDFQNFHKTLELPPPTTIVGLAGAALGFSPLKAQEFFAENQISIGVYGAFMGKCSDTWKYSKRTKEMWLYRTELDGSIIQKELLIHNRFIIVFSGNKGNIEELKIAFFHPVYALTLGNSDSLAKILHIEQDLKEVESNEIEQTIVEGNVIDNVIRLALEKMEFSIYQTPEPISYDLPVSFSYDSDYGKRTVSGVKTFSIIGKKMKLNYTINGLLYRDIFIPTISLL
ncbi:MAG TPA: CRISPR-associated protein Cas5 [Saprospiraceae bacterium]|nr:CRISPR-associated protein Cas5 [Saprospiraceae bacterium]